MATECTTKDKIACIARRPMQRWQDMSVHTMINRMWLKLLATIPTTLLLRSQGKGSCFHLNAQLKMHRGRISCTVHTAKHFLRKESCGDTCKFANFGLHQYLSNQERIVYSPCAHSCNLCLRILVNRCGELLVLWFLIRSLML